MSTFELDNFLPPDYLIEALRTDVIAGLTANPKTLPPKWFYDERGGQLFEEITRLPEYYPTRAEREILTTHAADIAAMTQAASFVELGAGTALKTRLLLDALKSTGSLQTFMPVDVNAAAVMETAQALVTEYPDICVHGFVADFEHQLSLLPDGRPRLTALIGGTIGNLDPWLRSQFLAALRASLQPGDWFLLGTDLVKDPEVLVAAYDDSAGVTAEFNRNVLLVINRELKADFNPTGFVHRAYWNPENEWIEMRLHSTTDQEIRIEALDLTVHFSADEEMRTEISAKFRKPGVEAELAEAGFCPKAWWTDAADRFAVSMWQAV